jgi:CheY-like chemotaxis protein
VIESIQKAQGNPSSQSNLINHNQYQENELFDVIVLDLQMPISDGFEACKNILLKYDDTNVLKMASV